MYMPSTKHLFIISLASVSIGYTVYIGLTVHSLMFGERYEGFRFIEMLDTMYAVSLVWFVTGLVAFGCIAILIKKTEKSSKLLVVGLLSLI